MPIKLFWYHCRRTWTLRIVRIGCLCHARRWASPPPCGGFHIGGAHLEVCVGWYPSQDLSLGAPLCRRGGFDSGFVLKCTHQTHLIKGLQYVSPLALFVSGVLACFYAGMAKKNCFPHKTQIWFCLIVLNKRWNTHTSSRYPMVVGWGEWGGWIWGKFIMYNWGDECNQISLPPPCLVCRWWS